MFSGIFLKQLIAELYQAIADIAAKLYINTNNRNLPQKAIAIAIAGDLKVKTMVWMKNARLLNQRRWPRFSATASQQVVCVCQAIRE